MQYLVGYDIQDEKIQAQLRKCVQEYSCSGQKSAYECELNPSATAQLKRFIGEKISQNDAFCIIKIQQRYWQNISEKHLYFGDDNYIYLG